MRVIDHVVVFQRPGTAFTVKHPRKHCVRNVQFRPFYALHNAQTTYVMRWQGKACGHA